MAFREISVEELKDNPFTLINKDWMLITAGDQQKHNTMTASWGSVGELWGKYVSTIYWCLVTAIYLGISLYYGNWGISWIIWPVTAVLYAVVQALCQLIFSKK